MGREKGRTGTVERDGAVDHTSDEGMRGLEVRIVFEQEQRVEVALQNHTSADAQNAREGREDAPSPTCPTTVDTSPIGAV